MNAKALVTLALGTLLVGAACRSDQVAERWQKIERDREGGEQAASIEQAQETAQAEEASFRQASLLIGNMERQIERKASLATVFATRRAAEVELMEVRPTALAQEAEPTEPTDEERALTEVDEPALALAAIDRRRMEIRHELERAPFVLDADWSAFVSRLQAMTQGLRGDVQALARGSEAVGTS